MDVYRDFVPTSQHIREWHSMGLATATANGTVAAAIHGACYLCDMAVDHGVMTTKEAISDRGIIHELAHASAGDATRGADFLAAMHDRVLHVEAALAAMPKPMAKRSIDEVILDFESVAANFDKGWRAEAPTMAALFRRAAHDLMGATTPTQDAYDAACKALMHWRAEANRLGALAGQTPREMSAKSVNDLRVNMKQPKRRAKKTA